MRNKYQNRNMLIFNESYLPSRRQAYLKASGRLYFLVLLLGLLVFGLPVLGAATTPEEVVGQVQKRYEATKAFRAEFRQEARLKSGGGEERASGELFFQKPSQMRWEYREPEAQKKQVIVDGKEVFIYMPQDRLVLVYPLQQVLRSDLVLRFFSGLGRLQEDFSVAWATPPKPGSPYRLELIPLQPTPELKELVLTIEPRTYLVQALEFSNAYGDFTRMTFSATELNPPLSAGFFRFQIPAGVEVVREKMF